MRSLVSAVVSLALLIGVIVGLSFVKLDFQIADLRFEFPAASVPPDVASKTVGKSPTLSKKREQVKARVPDTPGLDLRNALPRLDIARISPKGVSVFAGQAKPFQRIGVHTDDFVVGYTRADAEGNWVLVTEDEIRQPNSDLKIRPADETAAGDETTAAAAQGGTKKPPGQMGGEELRDKTVQTTSAEVNRRLMASLEALVAETEKQAAEATSEVDKGAVKSAAATPPQSPLTEPLKIPIPVQFVYREATFTNQGKIAVRLLLRFLNARQPELATLSGHADERGSHEMNLALSRQRLEAVRRFLRAAGYTGKLILEPKGETEPFAGFDRDKLSPEARYQLDRRVELRLEGLN